MSERFETGKVAGLDAAAAGSSEDSRVADLNDAPRGARRDRKTRSRQYGAMTIANVHAIALIKGAVEGDALKHSASLLAIHEHARLPVAAGLLVEDDDLYYTATAAGKDFYVRHRLDRVRGGRANNWVAERHVQQASQELEQCSALAYSYCETVTAGPSTPWHIRVRGAGEPLQTGGGIKGRALCGRDLNRGWDIGGREVSESDLKMLTGAVCAGCAEIYRKEAL